MFQWDLQSGEGYYNGYTLEVRAPGGAQQIAWGVVAWGQRSERGWVITGAVTRPSCHKPSATTAREVRSVGPAQQKGQGFSTASHARADLPAARVPRPAVRAGGAGYPALHARAATGDCAPDRVHLKPPFALRRLRT